jgi:hypothetical protein
MVDAFVRLFLINPAGVVLKLLRRRDATSVDQWGWGMMSNGMYAIGPLL